MAATAKAQSDTFEVVFEAPTARDADQLLVAALNAVARLRDTVDRIVVFSQLRQLLEHEQRALEQTVANEQGALDKVVREGQARINELRGRLQYLRQVLGAQR